MPFAVPAADGKRFFSLTSTFVYFSFSLKEKKKEGGNSVIHSISPTICFKTFHRQALERREKKTVESKVKRENRNNCL